ncbi:glycosyltransferase family 2 protein [Clostridium sp. BSD9I1]|uniref:glycosyltransferase family 2 protein n=1 Tax=Clostridium sp. BSD9I1 TaxID=2003589 RepID=UPI001647B9F8|nr:glycosyltransferase family 2 protein [Clostridium sp. BSD9I1]
MSICETCTSLVNDNNLKNPVVSIIMPVYNGEKVIADSIRSVQNQSFKNWELIIVNDNSIDKTIEVVKNISQQDSRIKIYNNIGKGVSCARNRGLELANGKFITFLDSDDVFFHNALKNRVEALLKNPNFKGVYCRTELVDDNLKKLDWQMGNQTEITFRNMSSNPIHLNSIMGQAQIFKSICFKIDLPNGEDWLYISDILRSGATFYRVDGCAIGYRIHSGSTVCNNYLKHENNLIHVIDSIYSERAGLTNVLPEFINGLTEPSKESVFLHRRIGLLIWLILEQRAEDMEIAINELHRYDMLSLSSNYIRNQIKFQIMRYYVYRGCELEQGIEKDSKKILNFIDKSNIYKEFPGFTKILRKIILDICEFGYKVVRYDLQGLKEGQTYLLYGTGSMSERVCKNIELVGANIKFFTDSNPEKWGGKFKGKKVIPPHEIFKVRNEFDKIVIASSFNDEIAGKLLSLGFKEKIDFL